MGKISQTQSNAEDPQANKLAPKTEPTPKSQPDEAATTPSARGREAMANHEHTSPQAGDDDVIIVETEGAKTQLASKLAKATRRKIAPRSNARVEIPPQTVAGGSKPKSNGAASAAAQDDSTPEPPKSPSSVVEDFKPQDIRKGMRGAIFDAKPTSQTILDTGIEVIRVGRPNKFVRIFPTLKFGYILPPEDQDDDTPTCLVAPDIAKLSHNALLCRTAILVIAAEPVPEGAVWPVYWIWPLLQESHSTGEVSEFMKSALLKVQSAIKLQQWMQFKCIKKQKIYTLNVPDQPIVAEVKWPSLEDTEDEDVAEFILLKGFEGRYIDSDNDPRLKARRSRRIE